MEVQESARKHDVPDADILHAWNNAVRVGVIEYGGEDRIFVIGPDRGGALLELVAVPAGTPTRIIHADRLRPKHYDLLR
ncbi:MAG: hypothetical protein LBB54_06395 [Cellulomonadaceae bacterium]|jgi:hypothetical protein|nr:hypothetical protein [Cellulomonadaceae bacterium]